MFETYTVIALAIIICFLIIGVIKSFVMGPSFSIIKWISYGSDYMKWFKFKQSYIAPKDRTNFNKKKE